MSCGLPPPENKKSKEKPIQNIVDMNYRLLLLAGYSLGVMHNMESLINDWKNPENYKKYRWLIKAYEDLIYFDKPLEFPK